MRIARTSDTDPTPMDGAHFSGPVSRSELAEIGARPDGSVIVVYFAAAARTNWHRHSQGQVLYVLAGAGRVGVRTGGSVEILPGDLVYAPAAEEHWYGAAESQPMTQLTFSFGEAEWLEPVTDE
jgi:quercetin dioxygenase-like cupin family protein